MSSQTTNDRRSGIDRRCVHNFCLSPDQPVQCYNCFRLVYSDYGANSLGGDRRRVWVKQERVFHGEPQDVEV